LLQPVHTAPPGAPISRAVPLFASDRRASHHDRRSRARLPSQLLCSQGALRPGVEEGERRRRRVLRRPAVQQRQLPEVDWNIPRTVSEGVGVGWSVKGRRRSSVSCGTLSPSLSATHYLRLLARAVSLSLPLSLSLSLSLSRTRAPSLLNPSGGQQEAPNPSGARAQHHASQAPHTFAPVSVCL